MGDLSLNLGRSIRSYRQKLGWKVKDLATVTGLGSSQISRIELGETWISERQLGKISYAFGMAPHQLFAMADENSSENRIQRKVTLAEALKVVNDQIKKRAIVIQKRPARLPNPDSNSDV